VFSSFQKLLLLLLIVTTARALAQGQSVVPGNPYSRIYEIVDHSPGAEGLCTDCDRELREAKELLAELIKIDRVTPHELNRSRQPGAEDFLVSRTGILVHRDCFEPGRWVFDIEEAIVDSMIGGMSCLAEGEQVHGDNGAGLKTSTKFSIFPHFLRYMNKQRWTESFTPYTTKPAGTVFYDNCDNVKTDPYFGATMLEGCEVIEAFGNRPKLFCSEDLSFGQLKARASEGRKKKLEHVGAYASAGSNEPVIMNYANKTKIYNGPTISFNRDKTMGWSKQQFESVLFHEMFHNLGYVHKYEGSDQPIVHNDYAIFCQAWCFRDAHPDLTKSQIESAETLCFQYKTDEASHVNAKKILWNLAK
jgi:hypothetical protein